MPLNPFASEWSPGAAPIEKQLGALRIDRSSRRQPANGASSSQLAAQPAAPSGCQPSGRGDHEDGELQFEDVFERSGDDGDVNSESSTPRSGVSGQASHASRTAPPPVPPPTHCSHCPAPLPYSAPFLVLLPCSSRCCYHTHIQLPSHVPALPCLVFLPCL